MPKYDVTVQLTGEDGNAWHIITRVQCALAQEVSHEAARAWLTEAMEQPSYDVLLVLARNTVNVK